MFVIGWKQTGYGEQDKANFHIAGCDFPEDINRWKYFCAGRKIPKAYEIDISYQLGEAHVFETLEEAEAKYTEIHEISPFPHILEVTSKELFIARLNGS